MKASPVRPGDFIEFFAEIDLLVALSVCPGGDCGASRSDDAARCYPLKVEVHRPREEALAGWQSTAQQIFPLAWNPVKGRLRLIRGSLEPVSVCFGRWRSCTCPRASAVPQQADYPLRYINRLFVPIADICGTAPNHRSRTLAIIEPG